MAFDSQLHLHRTVKLIRRTWDAFLESLKPEYQAGLSDWLAKHAEDMLPSLSGFDEQFEEKARRWSYWQFNKTP